MFLGPDFTAPPPVAPKWKLVTSEFPLTLDVDEVKVFINRPVEDNEWNAEIESFIRVAQRLVENHCQMVLPASTWVGSLPMFYDRIMLMRRPFLDVTKIEYVERTTGTITEVPAGTFHALPIAQDCGMVFLGEDQTWPDAVYRQDSVRITARAGFAVNDDQVSDGFPPLPDEIRHALLMAVAALDATRGDEQATGSSNTTVYAMKASRGGGALSAEVMSLLAPWKYRRVTLA